MEYNYVVFLAVAAVQHYQWRERNFPLQAILKCFYSVAMDLFLASYSLCKIEVVSA
jgi:hypothetical protein